MIVICPACAVRIRLDRQRLGGKRVTLRCSRCRSTFKTEIAPLGYDPSRIRVAIAHSDPALCLTIRDLVAAEGMDSRISHDAEGLLRQIETFLPQVLLIDVAIPGRYVFEVISELRNCRDLPETRIILLSSVYKRTAYKRTPTSLYGADDYIEKHHLPDDLVPKIRALLPAAVPIRGESPLEADAKPGDFSADEPAQISAEEMKSRIRAAENAATTGGEAIEKAERLARIIVADIALYSQEKVEEGIRKGNLFTLLAKEIEEGRRLFTERIAPDIRRERDFLQEAIAAYVHRRREEMQLSIEGVHP